MKAGSSRKAVLYAESILGRDWRVYNGGIHWQKDVADEVLNYWPTTGRWHYMHTSYEGSPQDLKRFIAEAERSGL